MNIFLRIAKDSTIYGLADFFSKIFIFCVYPILANYLSINSFGILELISTTTTLIGLILNCGLNNSTLRFYWDENISSKVQKEIVSTGIFTIFIFGILTFGICLGILFLSPKDFFNPDQNFTIKALISSLLIMIFSQWSNYILDILRLKFSPFGFFFFSLLSRLSTISAGFISVVYFAGGIDQFLGSQALIYFPILPFGLWMIRDQIGLKKINFLWAKKLINYGYPFIFAAMAYWIFGSIDRWMLFYLRDTQEVGIYSIAFRFSLIPMFLSNAFGQAWSPLAIKIKTNQPYKYKIIYGYILLILLLFIVIAASSVSLFSGEILNLLMPKEYSESSLTLCILSLGAILQASQQITAVGISIEKKTFLFAKLTWLTAAINIVANFIFIEYFGSAGAAIATFLSYLFLTLSYLYFTQKLHPIVLPKFRLCFLIFIASILGIISVTSVNNDFNIEIIFFKFVLLISCIVIGSLSLPFSRFRNLS